MISLDPRVSIIGIQPETIFGFLIVNEIFRDAGHALPTRSICDGDHSPKSLHYVGYAFDVTIHHLGEGDIIASRLVEKCRSALGSEWDVVLEPKHIHFEFQPKVNRRDGR